MHVQYEQCQLNKNCFDNLKRVINQIDLFIVVTITDFVRNRSILIETVENAEIEQDFTDISACDKCCFALQS